MSCTCNKNNTTNRCGCNKCDKLGCKDIVYPDCIVTKTSYPCIGVGAGKTGTVLFAAIDAALCSLSNTSTVVEGCTQQLSSGDYVTITSTPSTVGGVTTYTVCLGTDIINLFNALQSSIDDVNVFVDSASGCLFDGSGGCQIDNIQTEITNITNTINSLTDESWKTIGGGGNMENGQPVPSLEATLTLPIVTRLRRQGTNHVEVNIQSNVEVDGLGQAVILTLPANGGGTNYRPSTAMLYQIAGLSSTSTDTYTGFVIVQTNGVVTVNIQPTGVSTDTNWKVFFNESIPTD